MIVLRLSDEIKSYNKDDVYDRYTRIIEDSKEYDKISKTKMLDDIYKLYSDIDVIINICTEKELRYLKKLIDKDPECQLMNKYSFEISNLSNKFLICNHSKVEIPEEIYDKVVLALNKVKWKDVKNNDKVIEILVGICRVYGKILVQPLLEISSGLLNLDKEIIEDYLVNNYLFNYHVMFMTEFVEDMAEVLPMFIYRDYYELVDALDEERLKYLVACTKKICKEDYINIFYYGFNINNNKVKNFYKLIRENSYFDVIKSFILETSLLNRDRTILENVLKNFVGDDKSFFKLMNEALDEMPSGVLNGATPNELKYMKLEK